MQLLKELICNTEIDLAGKTIYREAVRGIIIQDDKLLMVFSTKNGDYKFPGGGIQPNETKESALRREVREETGRTIAKIQSPFGKMIECDKALEAEYDVFKMTSYYFICTIEAGCVKQKLDDYEKELGFRPIWTDIDTAIQANTKLIQSSRANIPRWTPRETFVLEVLKQKWNFLNYRVPRKYINENLGF